MKYRIEKENGWWYGYIWDDIDKEWDYISGSASFTKIWCKHFIKKYHSKIKTGSKNKFEEFELE